MEYILFPRWPVSGSNPSRGNDPLTVRRKNAGMQRFFPRLRLVAMVIAVLGVPGCDSPSPGFARYPQKTVTVEGSRFSVHYSPYKAQAIRTNPEWGARQGAMLVKGAKAIMMASGCEVLPATLRGDAALVKADIKCDGVPEKRRPARRLGLDCDLAPGGRGHPPADIACDIVER
jgi:hypothetical protein